jgi:hypothetical protein
LVRCQVHIEEDDETVCGMETNMQGVEDDRDDEVVVFPGGADQRAVEDNKFLNLSKTRVMTHLLMLGSAV